MPPAEKGIEPWRRRAPRSAGPPRPPTAVCTLSVTITYREKIIVIKVKINFLAAAFSLTGKWAGNEEMGTPA